jgi:hypothetical protein
MTDGSSTRFPRVDALLGARLDTNAAPEAFEMLVDEQVAEFDQLEFKREMYAATEDARCELAKDVCDFANATGGVLICGIAEFKGTASKLMPFEVSDSDVRHVNSVVAQRVAPMPAVDVFTVADTGTGYLVISVPASPWAPHISASLNSRTGTGTASLPRLARLVASTRFDGKPRVSCRGALRGSTWPSYPTRGRLALWASTP